MRVVAISCAMMFSLVNEGRTQGAPDGEFIKSFRPSFVTSFVGNCISSSGADDTTRPIAIQVCQCAATAAADRIIELNAYANPSAMEPIVEAEIKRCFDVFKNEMKPPVK
jgi:hypothetical protein